jgi:hypothetical protein
MFQIDSDAGTILLASSLTPRDINVTHHLTVTATDTGTRPMSSSIQLCVRVVEMAVGEQPKPVKRQGNQLLSHLVLSRSLLILVVLLGVIGTLFILLSVICLIRRLDTRRRQGFKRPPCIDDKYQSQGQYNCRMAALTPANGNRRNGQTYVDNEGSEWTQLDRRLALKSAHQCDCHDDNDDDDTGSRYKSVIRALESSPRRQLNGDCRQRSVPAHDNTKVMTTFGGTMPKSNILSSTKDSFNTKQQHPRYQVININSCCCFYSWCLSILVLHAFGFS